LNKIHSLQVFTYSSSVLASLPNDYLTSLHKTEFLDQLMLYAETKLRAESIISDFLKSPSIKYVLLNRYTNVFGTHPFGTDSLFSYVLNQIFKPNSVIEIHSAKNSRVNFVYDTEVHKKLIEYVSNLDFDGGPHLRTNYIAESRSLTLGDWMNRFLNAINPDCVELVYGNRPTFWDFFCDPSPLISPDSFENYLGFQRMCKNIARIR